MVDSKIATAYSLTFLSNLAKWLTTLESHSTGADKVSAVWSFIKTFLTFRKQWSNWRLAFGPQILQHFNWGLIVCVWHSIIIWPLKKSSLVLFPSEFVVLFVFMLIATAINSHSNASCLAFKTGVILKEGRESVSKSICHYCNVLIMQKIKTLKHPWQSNLDKYIIFEGLHQKFLE